MKKVISGLFMCAALVAFASCKKEKKVNCTEQSKKASAAMEAYAAQPSSVEKCKEARDAYKAFVNGDCFSSLSAEQKAIFESTLESFDCEPQ